MPISVCRFPVAVAAVLLWSVPAFAEDMTAKIQELNAAWDAALNGGDASKVASMYTEDAKVVAGDGTVKQGREEIETLFQSYIDSGFGQHKIDMADVNGVEDLVYETGSWSGVGGDGNTYGGKILLIFERTDGDEWLTALHMWN